jgi:excinuclease ABC subunit C
MTFDELKEKALSLPYEPGVYLMRDKDNAVIYVGKAKKLKNRVSQYFQETASHTAKTRMMVSKIHHFDVIVAASEFEALVLECSLIKRHMPKYNILLKDDKGYPYIRLNVKDLYPRLILVSKISKDGAEYYGPFGSRGTTQQVIDAIVRTLRLPQCSREFPRDIGKDRPCLNFHMNQCAGWCRAERTQKEYAAIINQARDLLRGDYKAVATEIRKNMQQAAEDLEFEQAAMLRDRLSAVEALGQKQLVTALSKADTDVIGYGETESKACLAVLHYSGGNLLDKDYEVFPRPDDKAGAVSSLVKQYYLRSGFAPKDLLLPFEMEDADLFAQYLQQQTDRKVRIRVPLRCDFRALVELSNKNAQEEAERMTDADERLSASLSMLGRMLRIEPPQRIESYDISNISGTDIVAGMVVFVDGKPRKSEYKRFQIEGLAGQDDYGSMRQVITRRFAHYKAGDKGFSITPSLLLIDGGIVHAQTAVEALQALELSFPVFGMVKDDRHRTRALVTPEGDVISIDSNQTVFSFIGNIQEETHRFAISYHRQKRSKRLKYSALDRIPGIGPKRKQELLKQFKSISAISQASINELERLLPKDAAAAVYHHFHQNQEDV